MATDRQRPVFSRKALALHAGLTLLTFGLWLPAVLAIWLWKTGRRQSAKAIGFSLGGIVALTVGAVVLGSFLGPTDSATGRAEARAKAACDRLMNDAATRQLPNVNTTKLAATDSPKIAAAKMTAACSFVVVGATDFPNYASVPGIHAYERSTRTTPQPSGDTASVDEHTRAYVGEMESCVVEVGLVIIDARKNASDIALADSATSARDTCDQVRSNLEGMNTDHFGDQANEGYYGIDRYKSGLNALLTYIDTAAPTKLIEARNKLDEGDQAAAQAIRDINQRRRDYGLAPINP